MATEASTAAEGAHHRLHLRRHQIRNANEQLAESFTPLERAALVVTNRVGTFGFFLAILTWSVLWLGWNTVGPHAGRFDPAPAFVLWLFISNLIQIMLMPLLLVGQNLQARHSEIRAENDFAINKQAEAEVETILAELAAQRRLLEELAARLPAPIAADPAASPAP